MNISDKKDLTLIIGSTPNSKLVDPFLKELVSNFENAANYFDVIISHDGKDMHSQKTAHLLQQIETDYVLLMQEDMFLYDAVDPDMFLYYLQTMKMYPQFVSLRLAKGGLSFEQAPELSNGIFYHAQDEQYPFCLYYSLWRRDALIEFLMLTKDSTEANEAFKTHNLQGLFAHNNDDTKRGMFHYENKFFPFMNTARLNDQWNTLEYSIEIENLKREHNLS